MKSCSWQVVHGKAFERKKLSIFHVQTVKFKQRSHGQKEGMTCMDALMPQAHECAGAAYNTQISIALGIS
ncbi:MAG: hypothetical protein V3T17_05620 [Pseudomonadales bacterium]